MNIFNTLKSFLYYEEKQYKKFGIIWKYKYNKEKEQIEYLMPIHRRFNRKKKKNL